MLNADKNKLSKYGQYTSDLFLKLDFNFEAGKKMLDVGCGPATDTEIFINEYHLDTYGLDVYKHERIDTLPSLKFVEAGILQIPFPDDSFDYVFLHDVLHHIDEEHQSNATHVAALKELKRVVKESGCIIVVEGNRYNPLFYPHMVKMLGHDHWKQSYFKSVMSGVFQNVEFRHFEAHVYPKKFLWFWKFYEYIMERFVPDAFSAYNVALIRK
jgi:ubiquinone/menaquinone biosynthesis C-methylase UbiE